MVMPEQPTTMPDSAPPNPQPKPPTSGRRPRLVIGLGVKVIALVLIATILLIALFAYLGTAALSENTQRTMQERVILAQTAASHIDYILANIENGLTAAANQSSWRDAGRVNESLAFARRRTDFFTNQVLLVDRAGQVVAAQPPLTSPLALSEIDPVRAALSGKAFAVSRYAQPLSELGPTPLAAVPIRDSSGEVIFALVISIDLTSPNIRTFTDPIGLGKTGYMDLGDIGGTILASTRPERVGSQSDHGNTLAGLIRDHRQAVSACHDCHTTTENAEPSPEVLAFAPLNRAPWGVTVRQSEEEVFASTYLLQTRIFTLLVVVLVGALVLAYLMSRSLITPVQALTHATRRIAQGDLESPIRVRGPDELGILARSLDEMRVRLNNSTEEIQALNRDLDTRVKERTAAYQAAARENARLYAEVQRKEQLRGELLHRVISAQEDERKRIARELHDETSQGLSALMIGLDTVRMALANDPSKVDAHLSSCKTISESLLKNVHRLIADLRPTLLDDLGLVPAIAWYGEQRLQSLGITFQLREDDPKVRLPLPIETALFRIAQEAITNVTRHARATMVTVHLACQDGWVVLQVTDDGAGFDPRALQTTSLHGRSLGLRGMQERATILGGEFELGTARGKGTTITVRVPLPQKELTYDQDSRPVGG
jgi:signal transduction histidine kinase